MKSLPTEDLARAAAYCQTPRPIVKVKLTDPNQKGIFVDGIVDSGAVPTVLPEYLMPALGVDRESCVADEETLTLSDGSRVPVYRYEPGVEATIAGTWRLAFRPIRFSGSYNEMVLGMEGFFDHFDVQIRRSVGAFTLEAHEGVEVLPEAFWMHEEQADPQARA